MNDVYLLENLTALSEQFAQQRHERQVRRNLDPGDFDKLREIGFPQLALPREEGGLWLGVSQSTRLICETLRTLAQGDSSVALVCAMHPAVLSYWLAAPESVAEDDWRSQLQEIFQTVRDGRWWGTITSEPGSGGDVARTRAIAYQTNGTLRYDLTGRKHFGSGSGVVSYMVTTAVPEGESQPDWFFLNVDGLPWDGSQGMELVAEWDGHGMTATQSHAMSFEGFPATRIAWPGHLPAVAARTGGFIGCLFTSVVVGIVDVAMATAESQLKPDSMRSFERVEWARARMEHWLIVQAYEGMLRSVEQKTDSRLDVLQGKTAIAELAESVLGRLCKIIGGGAYSRRSPFGFWFQDVRALGFLRPPWGLAFQTLIDGIPEAAQ